MFLVTSQFTQPLLAIGAAAGALSAGGAAVLVAGLWLPFGPGARRRRAFRRAQRCFQQGAWQEALTLVKEQQNNGRLQAAWEGRLRNLEGECRRLAGEQALQEQRFEEGREHFLASAQLLGLGEQDAHNRVIDTMLDNVRRLFSSSAGADIDAANQLAERVLALQTPCAEASFWQGLGFVRQERNDLTLTALRAAYKAAGDGFFDPAFYLGAFLLRQGSVQEAVRYLSEANRLAPSSLFAVWQLGLAILAAGGDSQIAARALQKTRDRLTALRKNEDPRRLWLDSLPEGKSYVRRLALKYPYTCPLLGNNVSIMLREVQQGLGQGHYRHGNFQEAVQQYTTVLHESPPTAPVLRGLGQSLARLERYEEAYNHLRAAYDREEPKSAFTAGYLALCAARGKPTAAEDRLKNIEWALRLISQFEVRGNSEWAELCNAIHAEARASGLSISAEDQVRLCEVLASVAATDRAAAAAYEHLAATFPEQVRAEYAWLHSRAVQQHRCGGERELELFARTFQEEAAARAFYAERHWDFEEMEVAYLERAATRCPGKFPEILGLHYAARGEALLLARSRSQEQAGNDAGAMASAGVLLALSPGNGRALDRLAQLYFRRGDLDRSAGLLANWHAADPANPVPLIRLAIVEQKRGNGEGAARAIELALPCTHGKDRAGVAFLGARLALADLVKDHLPVPSTQYSVPSTQYSSNQEFPASAQYSVPGTQHSTGSSQTSPLGTPYSPASDQGFPAVAPYPVPGTQHSAGSSQTSLSTRYSVLGTQYLEPGSLATWQRVIHWLTECLKEEPDHQEARWCLAAVHALLGDHKSLGEQSAGMKQPGIADARFQFMAACSHLAAGDTAQALAASALAEQLDTALASETAYLRGLAFARAGNAEAAGGEFEHVAQAAGSPSRDHAQARLGLIRFANGHYEDAVACWQAVDPSKRAAWRLDEPLRATVLLSALLAVQAGEFERAANRLRETGRLGHRDRRLGGLLILALVRAGQRLLHEGGHGENGANTNVSERGLEAAGRMFEQALNAGSKQPEVAYLLALAYKRQGKLREARAAFRRISAPDANVFLQLGILSLREGQLAQAEQELADGLEHDPESYAIGLNLLMTRLSLGQTDPSAQLLPRLRRLAPHVQDQRLLDQLETLLNSLGPPVKPAVKMPAEMSRAEEERLVDLVRSLGNLDVVCTLLQNLAAASPAGATTREARFAAMLVKGKSLLERCDWGGAEQWLTPLKEVEITPEMQRGLLNLLGCCCCLGQDFERGVWHFNAALRLKKNDACVQQNLALVHEWMGKHTAAQPYWNEYFEHLHTRDLPSSLPADYRDRLAFDGFSRLATVYADKEQWSAALEFAQRAHNLRPNDSDTLEKLFHLYTQSGRTDEARRVLRKLRQARPGDGEVELYELDLMKVRNLDSIEDMVGNIEKVLKRNPNDARVEVRSNVMVSNILPVLERIFSQLSDQLTKVANQVRTLPKYQIDWSAVREVSRDLRQEFQRLRRLVNRCAALIKDDEQRRTLTDLGGRSERKMEQCRALLGG